MTKTFNEAYALAQVGHRLMMYGDMPYMYHIDGVIEIVDELIAELPPESITPDECLAIRILAAHHDLPEDHEKTCVTHAMIAVLGYSEDHQRWLRRLDNAYRVGSYQDNIIALAAEGEIAPIIVKLADNTFHRRPQNLAMLPPERRGIIRRYDRAAVPLRRAFDAFKDAAWTRMKENQ